jgi:transglutaminase-like putative cysteine protease
MKRCLPILFFLTMILSGYAENYLINGGQASTIEYRLNQRVDPTSSTKTLTLSFVVPQSFDSPTYKQRIEGFRLDLTPKPSERNQEQDGRGNTIIRATWKNPAQAIDAVMQFTATNQTVLRTLESKTAFPLRDLPQELGIYIEPTKQVQSDDTRIREQARQLVQGVQTEFDAVQRILTWVVDHMRYVTPPQQYDAVYAFTSGKGNCQNYSHLAAALMRSVGIPVRIVNGVTLKQPYTMKTDEGEFTFKMGQGRHSWIEVYYPDLGWVPFDPQQTELFVSNRFVRIEVGRDNEDTVNDGMVRWRQAKGAQSKPRFQEDIAANFSSDRVDLTMKKQNYGPRNMLLCPQVRATFSPVQVKPPPPPPKKVSDDKLKQLQYDKQLVFGNMEFPRGVNFAFARGPAEEDRKDEFVMRKNFMVETAEYVTSKMTQYAQAVILEKPLKLNKIGLALHKFGGSGQLWIEIMDDAGGKPGQIIATSDFLSLKDISQKAGYDWVDFDFSRQNRKLSPGTYWIGLGFTGGPIVNWFYTYGKPVGPVEGTRYKSVYDSQWSALAYEFNYRVAGWTTR